jgi:hypothetical protein
MVLAPGSADQLTTSAGADVEPIAKHTFIPIHVAITRTIGVAVHVASLTQMTRDAVNLKLPVTGSPNAMPIMPVERIIVRKR